MRSSAWTTAFVFAAAAFALLALLGAIASRHGVNADEGFYLLAGLRVLAGERLYADFFYPQMPYLPLAGALVIGAAEPSLFVGRLVSVVPGALLGGLLAAVAYRRSGRGEVAALVLMAYALHALTLNYLTVTKTYGLANLAMVGAFLLTVTVGRAPWRAFLAGLFIAIAVGTRLPVAPVALLLAFWHVRTGVAALVWFACGALVGALPCLWLFAADPDAFWFSNVGFHELRSEVSGWWPILQQKLVVFGKWLLLPQNLVLWVGAAAGSYRDRSAAGPPMACAAALAALYLYATPTYLEYMVQIIPFLLLAALPALAVARLRSPAVVVGCVIYAAGLLVALRPTAAETDRARKLALWDIDRVHAVATHLRDASEPNDRILSWWEGYPWIAGREGYAGVGFWESNVAKKLSPEDRERYHVLGVDELAALIAAGEPRLVVFPTGTWAHFVPILAENYEINREFGAIRVYARRAVRDGND